jgi:hypothetical protein
MTRILGPRPGLALALILVAVAAVQGATYWPGLMHVDSTIQYDQALSGQLYDWHPPAMAWLWRQFIPLWPGPAPMFLLQLGLYWSGFGLLALWALRQGRTGLAFAIVACALMPLSLARLGSILKDCLMAGALVSATGLLALSRQKRSVVLRLSALALLLFAATLRSNAFLACIPLLVIMLPYPWRRTRVGLFAVTLAGAFTLLLVMPVTNKMLNAADSDVPLSLIIFDLAGITEYSGVDVFPPLDTVKDPVTVNSSCYTPRYWDTYGWWNKNPCPIEFDTVRIALERTGESPYPLWVKAIVSHPIAYGVHRLAHFNLNVRFITRLSIREPVWHEPVTHYSEFAIQPTFLLKAIDYLAVRNAQAPPGWPIWWIAIAFGVLILGRDLETRAIAVPLALSAVLYGCGYLVLSVAAELRYHMWTTLAAMLAAVVALSDLYNGPPAPRRRLILAALPVIIVTIVGVAARLLITPEMMNKV